jgi:hypothetical protein
MKKKNLHEFLADERGQLDLIGNFLEILKTQPYILLGIFLAIILTTTYTVQFMGQKIPMYEALNAVFKPLFGAFNFGFDWRLFVIFSFLLVPASLIIIHLSKAHN